MGTVADQMAPGHDPMKRLNVKTLDPIPRRETAGERVSRGLVFSAEAAKAAPCCLYWAQPTTSMKVLSPLRHGYYAQNEWEVLAVDMQPESGEITRIWQAVETEV